MRGTAAPAGRARLFFALWPGSALQAAFATCARAAQAECGGRVVASDNIHLTLFFVGAVERARIVALEALAAAQDARAFALQFDRLGYWWRPRIVWAGAAHMPPELAGLVAGLRDALVGVGVPADPRRYVPHVTLVRDAKRAPARAALEPLAWPVRDFVLAESKSAGAGVRYEVIGRWPLGGDG